MDSPLVATKLRIPYQPQPIVRRDRLITALENGISHYKLIQISAPAGYGKTTLLADWARSSRFPVGWFSLDEDDNDLTRFLRCLLQAWMAVQPDLRENRLDLLLGSLEPDREAVLTEFINTANEVPEPVVLVLDDTHLLDEPSIHEALAFLIDHLPPNLHFVMAGRSEPPLPLARYRARRELLELRGSDLQFSPAEAAEFLSKSMQFSLPEAEIALLQEQVEGWAAGLQLAALGLRRGGDALGQQVVSGRQRYIADYLSEDVLRQQPEEMQQFLLLTGILDRLSGPLCDAVTGRGDGQAMLERTERKNLFLAPLDDRREWYRYHPVFADFLTGELKRREPDQVAELHRRAAHWHLDHDLAEPAFRHALAAQEIGLVIEVFRHSLVLKLFSGEINLVKGWFDALPEEWQRSEPEMGFYQAAYYQLTGQFDACIRQLDEVERLAGEQSKDVQFLLARITALRCFIACARNDLVPAKSLAQQALRDLPEEELDIRQGLYGSLGDTYRRNGRWEKARECYLKTLELPSASSSRIMVVHAYGALADLALRQGSLEGAAAYWRRAINLINDRGNWGRLPLPLTGWVYIRMGEILLEWNELSAASDHLSRGLERTELGGDVHGLIAGYLLAGRLKLAEGDREGAAANLDRARPLVEQAPFPEWTSRFERLQVEIWLAQDRLAEAVEWASQMKLEESTETEAAPLAAARALIDKGDPPSLRQAGLLLEHMLAAAEKEGRLGLLIEALALQALAEWKRGDGPRALTALERALRLAEPEGYIRLFADLGLPMARLLQEARSRGVMADYVGRLLEAFRVLPPSPEAAGMPSRLPEPLTAREQEILAVVAAGLTNREIAKQLVISPETVKKHTASIYGKLGASSRTEAVARARALGLLE